MASGRTHETINLVALGGLALGTAWLRSAGHGPALDAALPAQGRVAFAVAYLVGTFLVTPDLDLASRSVQAKSNWGVFGLLWVPYGWLFKHRGLSHSWLLGPATRLLYMALLGLALGWAARALAPAFGYELAVEARLERHGWWLALGAAAGYYGSQWMHLLVDGVLHKKIRSARKK